MKTGTSRFMGGGAVRRVLLLLALGSVSACLQFEMACMFFAGAAAGIAVENAFIRTASTG